VNCVCVSVCISVLVCVCLSVCVYVSGLEQGFVRIKVVETRVMCVCV